MTEPIDPEQIQRLIPMMTTEHFTLETGRGNTIAETNGRVTMLLGTISSTLIALAFIGQISRLGTAFYLFSLVLFPSLFLLGLFTFERVMQSGIEDAIYARGINRIRHFYVEVAPQMAPYFVLSTHDDSRGTMLQMGIVGPAEQRIFQSFLSTSGMVAVVNSIIAGVFAGLLLGALFSPPLVIPTVVGIVVFAISVWLHQRYNRARWIAMNRSMSVLFPSPSEGGREPLR
jgi:hypothetical protein